ncbi:MAG: hypothetical protein J7D61_16960 [Marichromatium sp.]|nr:hypothetical protein [Marichromatium sp.]
MFHKINKLFYFFCVFYVVADVSIMLSEHYGMTTRDETCRNEVMDRYYEKHKSLEHFSERSAMSQYVLMNGTLDGFVFE